MTDLDRLPEELTALLGSTASDAEVPPLPLRDILARGEALQRVRRRRAAIGTAIAAAVAVVVICLPLALAGHGPKTDPEPTRPTPTPTSTASGAESPALARVFSQGEPFQAVAGPDGALVTIWSTCPSEDQCHEAWRLTTGDGSASGLLPDSAGDTLLPTKDGAILTSYDGTPGPLLRFDGAILPLRQVASTTWGSAALALQHRGGLAILDPTKGTWSVLHGDYRGAATDDGTVWTETDAAHPRVIWSSDGRAWQQHTLPDGNALTTGPVAAQGGHVVAASAHIADDSNPLVDWSVTNDNGRTWSDVPASVLPFRDVDQMLVATSGTLFVNSPASGLFRSTDSSWTRFARVAIDHAGFIAPYGDGVSVLAWQHRRLDGIDIVDAQGDVTSGAISWDARSSTPARAGGDPSGIGDAVAGLSQGRSATTATISAGVLRVEGKAIARGVDDVVASSDESVMLLVRHGSVSAITRAGAETSLDALDGDTQGPAPVISPNGTYAAAVHTGEHGDDLVEWSLAAHRTLGSLPVDRAAERIKLDGIDDDGRIYATTVAPGGGFAWEPGTGRQPLTGAAADLATNGFGAVGPHGVVEAAGCDGTYAGISPSGSQMLCGIDVAPGIGVVSVSTHRVVPLGLPASAADVIGVGFESDAAALVLVASSDGDWLVRCVTSDGTCVRAAAVPPGTTFPTLPGVS